MKTKTRQLLALSTAFALALSISVTSCKKDKDDSSPMSATVNGTSIDFSTVTAAAANGEISMEGTKDSSYIIVSVPDDATANSTYDFEDLDMYYYDHKKNVIYASFMSNTHGSVTVTTHDKSGKNIAGKFDGVMYGWTTTNDSVVIKNGQFNTTYK